MARSGLEALLAFVFSETDCRVFESYSEFGRDLREFRSIDELRATFPLGNDPYGNGHAALLVLWSPSVLRDLVITRIALDPGIKVKRGRPPGKSMMA